MLVVVDCIGAYRRGHGGVCLLFLLGLLVRLGLLLLGLVILLVLLVRAPRRALLVVTLALAVLVAAVA